jgi:large subunit ribosomal protein L10e
MRLAFGKAVGTAARVEAGQKLMTVYSTQQYLEKIKDALNHAGYKLPSPSHLKTSVLKVSGKIIAAPKLVGEKIVAAPVVTEEAAAEPAKGAEAAKGAKGGKDAGKAAEPAKGAEAAKGVKGGKNAGKAATPAKDEKKGAAPSKGGKK